MSYYDSERDNLIHNLQEIIDNGEIAKQVLTFAQDLLELDAMQLDRSNRWNMVEDLLPPEGVKVLVVFSDGDRRTMGTGFVSEEGSWVVPTFYGGKVTHWRNLPDFPEET